MYIRPRLLAAFLLIGVIHQYAQTPRQKFEAFRKQARSEYSDFRTKANKDYASFMLYAWEEYSQKPAIPKPVIKETPPLDFQPKDKPANDTIVTIKEIVPPSPQPRPEPVAPVKPVPAQDVTNIDFAVFGTPCSVRYPAGTVISTGRISNAELSQQWTALSDSKYNVTLSDCLALRKQLHLCDWAYLEMLDGLGRAVYGDSNEARLLTAFLYCQSGYSMRLAKSGSRLFMLFASDYRLYDYSYFVVDGVLYYNYDGPKDNYAEVLDIGFAKERPLALNITENQLFKEDASQSRRLTSSRTPVCDVTVEINKNLLDFFGSYPTSMYGNDFMTRWALYASAPMSTEIAAKLYPQLKQVINGKAPLEAANILLNWVQTGFEYKLDDKVWGHDRAFFAEETLYYPYCDCEDRSILFSRLIRDLLGLDVALIYYPGHLATAVCFNDAVKGDAIMINDRKFIVCDPTYIGAPAGLQMPGLECDKAQAIVLPK